MTARTGFGSTLSGAATTVVVLCAIVLTGMAIRREIREPDRPVGIGGQVPQKDWKSHLNGGQRLGPADAPLVLVTFSDFQCPGCRALSSHLTTLLQRRGGDFAVLYRHFPLPMHSAATAAAVASECAGDQGRFAAMHDSLFARQKDLDAADWTEIARGAGVNSLDQFNRCIVDPATRKRVAVDLEAALALKAAGTPTLLVGGVRITGVPTVDQLDSLIDATLASLGTSSGRNDEKH